MGIKQRYMQIRGKKDGINLSDIGTTGYTYG